MTHARHQITTKECTRAKKGRPADISKISPGSVDKARCVVVCCDTMRFASCEALAMVNKNIVVQMEGFWRVCKASGSAVWHEWKWGWNAGGWGSKSYFEATCGATNAMEVCRSSAMGVVLAKAAPRRSMAFCEPKPPPLVLHTTGATEVAVRCCSRCDLDAIPPPSCRGSD